MPKIKPNKVGVKVKGPSPVSAKSKLNIKNYEKNRLSKVFARKPKKYI